MVSRLSKLMWYNTRILLDWNAAAAFALMALAPFIFSFNLLQYREVAKLSELYFSIAGIILFAYIGGIECQEHTSELVNVRAVPNVWILVLRTLIVTIFILSMIIPVLFYAKLRGSVFPLLEMTTGAAITAVFLGSIAYTLPNITNQVSTGYITAFAYYLMEYNTKGRYTGSLYLFSLMKEDFTPKYYLLMMSALILAMNFLYTHKFKSKLNRINE